MKSINIFSVLILRVILFMSLLGIATIINAQKFLLIETINDPKTVKIVEGQSFEYKIHNSSEWLYGTIETLMIDEESILFSNAIVSLSDISHIKRYRPIASYIGKGLMSFGAGWFVFGGLGAASGNYEFGTDTFVIGGAALATGWLINKLFYKRVIVIGDRYRLRMIDTTVR